MRDQRKPWRAPQPRKIKVKGDPGKPPQPARNLEIWELHRVNVGYVTLAREFGISVTRVRRILRRFHTRGVKHA